MLYLLAIVFRKEIESQVQCNMSNILPWTCNPKEDSNFRYATRKKNSNTTNTNNNKF